MKIYKQKNELIKKIEGLKLKQYSFGFVPTMGALHKGHLSLIEEGLLQNDYVVVSIFVNPTQFGNKEDLKKYPRTLEKDVDLLKTVSKDKIIVYAPTVDDIYSKNVKSVQFDFSGLENEMEGKFRKGHFNGVGTIVKRLFEIVKPDNAYFGEKDFQQLQIIKKLVENYHLPLTVVGCKIFREKDGLAMSSRNVRLKPNYRDASPFIYKTLKQAKNKFKTQSVNNVTKWVESQFKKHSILELEYFIIADEETLVTVKRKSKSKSYRAFIAVFADDIRLIDNLALN